ncbi:MAG TPA: HDOD domain-containing protein [Steroidobacteraceae bacterium]|jgi:HD-like signal output (HDOD) protein|nr:HDOD domain-containing protein [Steroidobacteraceae bacterium]
MSAAQLVWVLVGVAVVVITIAVLARARSRGSDPGAQMPSRERADEPRAPATSSESSPATPTRSEPPELRSARLAAQQALQTLAFSASLSPAPGAARPRPAATTTPEVASAAATLGNTDADHEAAAAAIRQTLLEVVERPNYAPRRPLLLPKLMQAMNDNEVSRRELARIIATDPALAGSLLRLANSPFYRLQPDPVESLDRAIALLGLEGMRSLIAAALLQPVFRISGGTFLQFAEITWEHTLYSGAAAEAHAAVLENTDPFAAQLLALIMGLATIVVFRVATDEFLARKLRPNPNALGALIELESAQVGRRIAASWELSERMDTALTEQAATAAPPASALGRSLQLGRFIGALTLLHAHGVMDEEQVMAALKSGGARGEAYGRIWSRLAASRAAA